MTLKRLKASVFEGLNLPDDKYPTFVHEIMGWYEQGLECIVRDDLQIADRTRRQNDVLQIFQEITNQTRLWELPEPGKKLVLQMEEVERDFYVPNEEERNREVKPEKDSFGAHALKTSDSTRARVDNCIAAAKYYELLCNVVYILVHKSDKKTCMALGPRTDTKETGGYRIRTFENLKRSKCTNKCKYHTATTIFNVEILMNFVVIKFSKKKKKSKSPRLEAQEANESSSEESESDPEASSESDGETIGSQDSATEDEQSGPEEESDCGGFVVASDESGSGSDSSDESDAESSHTLVNASVHSSSEDEGDSDLDECKEVPALLPKKTVAVEAAREKEIKTRKRGIALDSVTSGAKRTKS
jgi:hypothetical protein